MWTVINIWAPLLITDCVFDVNSGVLCKKGQQRLYCLRKLRSFNVDRTMMELFYKSYIEPGSVLFY